MTKGSKDATLKKRKKKLRNEKKKKNKETLNSDPSPVAPVRDGGEGTAGGRSGGRKVVTDFRFSSLHTDPRFREAPKQKAKVAIDSRFDRMFTDKRFLSSSAPVDKRGKPKTSNSQQSTLRHYYKIEEEAKRRKEEEVEESSDEEKEEEVEESSDEEDDKREEEVEEISEEEEEEEEEEDENEQKFVKSKSLKSGDSTEDESESDVMSEDELESDVMSEEIEEEEEVIPAIEKETHRLAIVNMDWRLVKAVDLYAMLSSFVPSNGHIKSVAVYPSEFGLQRMKEEEVHGPVALFDDEDDNSKENSDNEDQFHKKLLDYEKDRMRYYFAVAECDSVNTADYIYKECNEIMVFLNPLDLRFIPDSMEFKRLPRDVATEVPANYDYKEFSIGALQHTNVNLTWEEDEPDRARTLRRKFTDEELAELELKEFLASDESESDDDNKNETEVQPDKKATRDGDRYRALLLSGNGSDEEGREDGQDMEVTFNTGLEDISKRILEKKDRKEKTVWEEQLRKRRERKRARKSKSKYSSDDDSSEHTDQEASKQEDDFFLGEPASKKMKGKGKFEKQQKPQEMGGVDEASKQELELLLADDRGAETSLKGYNLKLKTAKGKKGREAIKEEKLPSIDLDDPRFDAIFTPAYAIDPTDPQFKRSAAYYRQLAQKEQKVDRGSLAEGGHVELPGRKQSPSKDVAMVNKGEKDGPNVSKSKEKLELSSMVKSIKLKSKKVELHSDGKTERNGKVKIRGKQK